MMQRSTELLRRDVDVHPPTHCGLGTPKAWVSSISRQPVRAPSANGSSHDLRLCIEILGDVLAVSAPAFTARVARIGRIAADLGRACGVEDADALTDLAFLSQLGLMSLPETIVMRMHLGKLLTSDERDVLRAAAPLGQQVLDRFPGFERESEIVRLHDVHATPTGQLPVEAAILRVAIAFDRLEAAGQSPTDACEMLRERDPMYSVEVLDQLDQHIASLGSPAKGSSARVAELVPGRVLVADVVGVDGILRLGAGSDLTEVVIERLRTLADRGVIADTVWVAPSHTTS